jgi:hypothetical protein
LKNSTKACPAAYVTFSRVANQSPPILHPLRK